MKNIAVLLSASLLAATSHATTLAAWNFYGTTTDPATQYSPVAAYAQDGNLEGTVQLSIGGGVNIGTLAINSWSLRSLDEISLASAISAGDYITFTLDPAVNFQVTTTNIVLVAYRGGTANVTATLFCSTTGFAEGNEISSGLITANSTPGAVLNLPTDGVAHTNAVEYRIYLHGMSGTTSSTKLYSSSTASDAVIVQGEVSTTLSIGTTVIIN